MDKIQINYAEFYITNVCNYNCTACNRLNNYQFSGHQYWSDYEFEYTEWSKRLHLKEINILGGEPTLNRTLNDWLYGINKLWPDTKTKSLSTNGTRLSYWKQIYKTLVDTKFTVKVNTHGRIKYKDTVDTIRDILVSPITETYKCDYTKWVDAYNQVKDISWPDCSTIDDYDKLPEDIKNECKDIHKIDPENFKKITGDLILEDTNGVKFIVTYYEMFVTAPLKYNHDHTFSVYKSDPNKAHDVCISKYCHHFVKGKLYKCHHVVLLPEFDEQYNVIMTDKQRELLHSYKPATINDSENELQNFVNNIRNVIPQCSLCPSKLVDVPLNASTEKLKVKKKITIDNI